ncbi:MAG: NAD(P)/FAD-dependent oxidoreductase [Candidatus Dormiibacterota bacterium]
MAGSRSAPVGAGPGAPRVVVLGAGFGGLTLTRRLAKAPVRVLLIDRNNYHLFSPLLYQVATAMLNPSEVAQPVRRLLGRQRNADFMQADIEGIDLERKEVRTSRGRVRYDTLVIATGSTTNFFGNASLADRSYPMKMLEEGLALRNRILTQFEHAEWAADEAERRRLLSFAIIGGGPTGIEFAGALSELVALMLRRDYHRIGADEPAVRLFEGGDRLLPAFDPRLSAAALRSLSRKHVPVELGALVDTVEPDRIRLHDGREIPAATVVWTAGVRGVDVDPALGAQARHGNRIPVDDRLRLQGHPEVFAIGDGAGRDELPMLIPVAMQQAEYLAAAIPAGGPAAPFRYRDPGIMATIGRYAGVAQFGRIRVSGVVGWGMWLFVHLLNVMTFRTRVLVLMNWAWDYFFYDRPIRIHVRAGAGPEATLTDPRRTGPVGAAEKTVR